MLLLTFFVKYICTNSLPFIFCHSLSPNFELQNNVTTVYGNFKRLKHVVVDKSLINAFRLKHDVFLYPNFRLFVCLGVGLVAMVPSHLVSMIVRLHYYARLLFYGADKN